MRSKHGCKYSANVEAQETPHDTQMSRWLLPCTPHRIGHRVGHVTKAQASRIAGSCHVHYYVDSN